MTHWIKKICRAASRVSVILCVLIVACSRMGDAEVREVGGLPCFAPAAKELKRPGANKIVGIWVYDLSREPAEEVWAFGLYGSSTPIKLEAGECITYGTAFAEAERLEPVALAKDTVYDVFLSSRLSDPYDSTLGFAAKFCLREKSNDSDSDSGFAVIQIMPDSDAWYSEKCEDI